MNWSGQQREDYERHEYKIRVDIYIPVVPIGDSRGCKKNSRGRRYHDSVRKASTDDDAEIH